MARDVPGVRLADHGPGQPRARLLRPRPRDAPARRPRPFALALAALVAASAAGATGPSGVRELSLVSGGRSRTALLCVPPGAPPPAGWPLVVMLHGAGGNARNALSATGWAELGNAQRFVTLLPNGTPADEGRRERFLGNPQTWNSGGESLTSTGDRSATTKRVDDIGFFDALLVRVRAAVPVDPRRLFFAGHSNGASMAFRYALARPRTVAAVGTVAGHLEVAAPATLPSPVSLLQVVGDSDPYTPLEGGPTRAGRRTVTAAPALAPAQAFARLDGLSGRPLVVRDDAGLRELRWGSPGPVEVRAIVVKGHGHAWPRPGAKGFAPERFIGPVANRIDAAEEMWEFFAAHPKRP